MTIGVRDLGAVGSYCPQQQLFGHDTKFIALRVLCAEWLGRSGDPSKLYSDSRDGLDS